MYVKRGDIPAISKALGLAMVHLRADTVMLPRKGAVLPTNMYYHSETVGWRQFVAAQSDISRFEAVDVATLFSLLHGIESSRIPGRPVFRAGKPSGQLVDLSSMLEDLSIAADVHFAVKIIRDGVAFVGGRRIEGFDPEIIGGIRRDLSTLCKDDYGLGEARRIWAMYEQIIGPELPTLTVKPNVHLSAESRISSGIRREGDDPKARDSDDANRRGRSLR